MPRLSLYLETTIVSFLAARTPRNTIAQARQQITQKWWGKCAADYDTFVSDVVLQEAARGDHTAAARRLAILAPIKVLPTPNGIERLLGVFLNEGVIPPTHPDDAAHLAFASLHEIDLLCTWNFRHLANVLAMRRLQQVCQAHRLFLPQICTPEELLGE